MPSFLTNHLFIWLGLFFGSFVALRLFVAVAYAIVKVLFPEWKTVIHQLQSLNGRSIQLATYAAENLPKLFGWLLMVAFLTLTLIYS